MQNTRFTRLIERNGVGSEGLRWNRKVGGRSIKGMLSALQKCDDEVKAQAALPKKVKLERYTLEDEKLILYYNAAYGKMDTVREVLCRAALVRSLT